MISNHLFRVSLYVLICLATIALWMGEDNPWPYIWLVFFAAVAAYVFTDQWGVLVVPSGLSPWLGVAAVAMFIQEELANYRLDPVLPLGHLILLFQIILLFHQKKLITYWLLVLTSFLQIVIAALHNSGMAFGAVMGLFLALIVWTMTQFLILRESVRHRPAPGGPAILPGWKRSVAGTLGSSLAIFLASMCLFLLIPRRGQSAWTVAPLHPGKYISGFDEQIRLGQLGTILESDEEVMTVRLFDEKGRPFRPSDEPYWRGVALVHYEAGRWERRLQSEPVQSPWGEVSKRYVRQEIRLQSVHRDVLFGMSHAFRGQSRTGEPLDRFRLDGTLIRPQGAPTGPFQYIVESALDADELPAREIIEKRYFNKQLTQVPPELVTPLQQYLAQLSLPPASDEVAFTQALLRHLQNPDEFDYSLRATLMDPNLDPVLDFLLNRKEGHCEYFASSLAMLLRVHDIPTRVVNGFKGGDWNELFGQSILVRQKHAHSWVEAILHTPEHPEPRWVLLDPTPGPGRQRIVAPVNVQMSLVQKVGDITRQLWTNYILNFNSAEQEAAVYGPLRRFIVEESRKLAERARALWNAGAVGFNWLAATLAAAGMFAFLQLLRLLGRWLSTRVARVEPRWGGEVGFLQRLLGTLQKILARWALGGPMTRPRIAFYDQLLRILEARGLRKDPSATPLQFAEYARLQLEHRPNAITVARIPEQLVERYYHMRFGNATLNSAQSAEIGQMLGSLALALGRKE